MLGQEHTPTAAFASRAQNNSRPSPRLPTWMMLDWARAVYMPGCTRSYTCPRTDMHLLLCPGVVDMPPPPLPPPPPPRVVLR